MAGHSNNDLSESSMEFIDCGLKERFISASWWFLYYFENKVSKLQLAII